MTGLEKSIELARATRDKDTTNIETSGHIENSVGLVEHFVETLIGHIAEDCSGNEHVGRIGSNLNEWIVTWRKHNPVTSVSREAHHTLR